MSTNIDNDVRGCQIADDASHFGENAMLEDSYEQLSFLGGIGASIILLFVTIGFASYAWTDPVGFSTCAVDSPFPDWLFAFGMSDPEYCIRNTIFWIWIFALPLLFGLSYFKSFPEGIWEGVGVFFAFSIAIGVIVSPCLLGLCQWFSLELS